MNLTARGLRRPALVLATLVAVVLPLAACTSGAPTGPGSPGGAPGGAAAAAELTKFYTQKLEWKGCADLALSPEDKTSFADPKLDCTYLQVPVDYAQPDGKTAQIAVLRQKASQPAQKIGSLLINPGGPGASGVSSATGIGKQIANGPLGQRFDLIGFDPRGVGASKPAIRCFTGPERDAERLDLDIDNSPAGVAQTEQEGKDYARLCEQRSEGREVLANVGTRDVVKDMDILRAALGDEKLTYLGYSYGTRIGYSYAEAFPNNVRALILDGALDPDQGFVDRVVAQSAGFQKAFDAFAASCAKRGAECPLGTDPKQANDNFKKLVLPLIDNPIALPGGRKLSYGDAITGTIQALYSDQIWEFLRRGLVELSQGRGQSLMRLADFYYGRQADGSYETILDAFAVINCVDDVPITDPAVILEATKRIAEVAPFRDDGRGPNPARDSCAFWPAPYTSEPHLPQVAGLPRVMVISVTGDPATPYQAGVNLAKALNARLLSVAGNQHTVALQGTPCVDDIVTRYLLDLTLPAEGANCKVTPS